MDITLGAISCAVGEERSIAELPELSRDPARLARFRSMGMDRYRASDESASDLAFRSIRNTLEAAGGIPVGALILCSETPGTSGRFNDIAKHCARYGLASAVPLGISLSSSGNFASGLQVAVALLRTGCYTDIVLATTDCAAGKERNRLMEPGVGIVSDGAASCLLSSRVALEYRVHGVDLLANNRMSAFSPESDYLAYSLESYKGRKEIFDHAFRGAPGLSPRDIRWLIANNYGLNTHKGFSSESGLPMERVFRDNVAALGHVSSADTLINLKDCSGRLGAGEQVLLLSTGPNSWGIARLEKLGTESPLNKEQV